MTIPFLTQLATDTHNLRLYVLVSGVPNVFQDDAASVPSSLESSSRQRCKLITGIDQGATRLNLATRRFEGGSLTITLQDDDIGTLAALFKPRIFRRTFLAAAISDSDNLLEAKNGSWASDGQAIYVGGETIQIGTVSGNFFVNCGRGAFNSEPQSHAGSSAEGAFIFDAPPSWKGRRVTLVGYFEFENGTTSDKMTLGTFSLSEAPKFLGDDAWQLNCVDLIEEFASKKVGGGIVDVTLPSGTLTKINANGNNQLVVGAGENFNQFVLGTAQTYVYWKSGDYWGVDELVSQVSTDTIEMAHGSTAQVAIDSVRHVAFLKTRPELIMLWLAASRLGDGANGTYDVLPGLDAVDFGGGEWRMGAGIRSSEIDDASFIAAARSSGRAWSYILDDEANLSDVLFEFCLHTQSAWGASRSGALTAFPLSYDGTAAQFTFDNSVIVEDKDLTIEYAENEIYPRVRLQCNYDINEKKYLFTLNAYDSEMQKRYPQNEASFELKSKTIVCTEGPGAVDRPSLTRSQIQSLVRRLQSAQGRGRAYVSVVCHLNVLAVEIGDVVTLSAPIVDLEGRTSISGRTARVIAMKPRYDDEEVDVTVELIDNMFRIAPAVTIATLVGTDLILDTTGTETASAKPARMFAVGDTIECWDVSAGTSVTHTVLAIVSDNRLTIDSALGFTLDPSKDFIKIGPQNTENTVVTDDGFTGASWLYQMPDDENDGTVSLVTRWS